MSALPKLLARQSLTLAGTRQQISTTQIIAYKILFVADTGNAGTIYIGDSTVSSTNGMALAVVNSAGQSFEAVPPTETSGGNAKVDLSNFYFDGSSSGDKVRVFYWTKA